MAPRLQARPIQTPVEDETRQRLRRELIERVVAGLRLGRDDLLGEVCCPASALSAELARRVELRSDAVAVDCAPAAEDDERGDPGVRWVDLDPLSFSAFPVGFDKILVSDALALIPEWTRFLENLCGRLRADDSRLLIVQRAPDPDLPLFKEARRRWEASYTQPEEVRRLLEAVGLRGRHESFVCRHWIRAERVPRMVLTRSLPILYTFTAGQLAAGAEETREKCDGRAWAVFTERLDLFTAQKEAAGS